MTRDERSTTVSRTLDVDFYDVVGVNLTENRVERFTVHTVRTTDKITDGIIRKECEKRGVAFVQKARVNSTQTLAVWDLLEILPLAHLQNPRTAKEPERED